MRKKPRKPCHLKWLVDIVARNGPVSWLPEEERGEAAELVAELELCKEGMECWQVKSMDTRERIVFNPKSRGIESIVQVKYINYVTSLYNIAHGAGRLRFIDAQQKSHWKVDYIVVIEDPVGVYKFLVLTNDEMAARIEKEGKPWKSAPERKPRIYLRIPRDLSDGWSEHIDEFNKLRAYPTE